MTIPPDTPVTIPPFVTEATAGLLLTQVPPVDGNKVVVLFTQIDDSPEILTAGKPFTVMVEVVLLQPVEVWVKVKVTGPADMPVTAPKSVTEATTGLLLAHVPPVAGDNVVVAFTQIAVAPDTVGKVYTVTGKVVPEHPEIENVKVAVPARTPVTTPAFVTVATEGLLLIQVPPEEGDNVVVPVTQIAEGPVISATGVVLTVTFVTVEVAEHPKLLVTFTE